VPNSLRGLDFTLVGLFAALAVDALRAQRDFSTALLAFVCAITAGAIAPGEMLVVAMTLSVALLIARSRVSTPEPEAARA
jgi:predicted branched-subunit amino acid permease